MSKELSYYAYASILCIQYYSDLAYGITKKLYIFVCYRSHEDDEVVFTGTSYIDVEEEIVPRSRRGPRQPRAPKHNIPGVYRITQITTD